MSILNALFFVQSTIILLYNSLLLIVRTKVFIISESLRKHQTKYVKKVTNLEFMCLFNLTFKFLFFLQNIIMFFKLDSIEYENSIIYDHQTDIWPA